MSITKHATPSRNFNILSTEFVPKDPLDGAEKYVLTTYVESGLGELIFIDTHTLKGEKIKFPGDMGAWALLYLPDRGELLVGTCKEYAYVHCLDLKTREWKTPLRIDSETYIWQFARGKDGKVYGVTYPGCLLLVYDPETHTLSHEGRVSPNQKNLYSRHVHTHPDGNILVSCGFDAHELYYFDIDKKTYTLFGVNGDEIIRVTEKYILSHNKKCGIYNFYDPKTLSLIERPIDAKTFNTEGIKESFIRDTIASLKNPPYSKLLPRGGGSTTHLLELPDGRCMTVLGQDLFIIENGNVSYDKIPAPAPTTAVFALAVDDNGVVWGSDNFGQTICSYNPKTGEQWASSCVTFQSGEVYGICPVDGKLFLTAYAGGDHIVYDPKLPWNQYENENPKTLRSCGEFMIRPLGRSKLGPDGNIWTGWAAVYGRYGGGISRINPKTYEVDFWHDMIPDQCYHAIIGGSKYVFATTNGQANGLLPKEDEFHLVCLDTDANILHTEKFELGQFPKYVAVVGGKLFMSLRDERKGLTSILVYDEISFEKLDELVCGEGGLPDLRLHNLCKYDENTLICLFDGEMLLLDATTYEVIARETIPTAAEYSEIGVGPDKRVWFGVRDTLYSAEFDK